MLKFYVRIFLIFIILFFSIGLLFSDPPDPITDLKVIETHFKQIKLQWTVPNSTETIKYYEIKFATYQITQTNWNNINNKREILIETPLSKGETTSYVIYGVENAVLYYFAIKSSTSTNKQPLSEVNNNTSESYGITYNTPPTQFSLSTPTWGVVISSPIVEFDWNDSEDPDVEYGDYLVYEIGLSTFSLNLFASPPSTPSFTGAVFIDNITTSYFILNAKEKKLTDNITYYWRVRVKDSEGKISWSLANAEQSKFIINHTVEAPLKFSLILPVDGSTVATTSNIFFDWEDAIDLDPQDKIKYQLWISSVSESSCFKKVAEDINYSSYTLSYSWSENTTYWWYIMAEDSFGSVTISSQTFRFIVNNDNNSPIQNFLLSPGTSIYQQPIKLIFTLNPTFYWTSSYDPDPYSRVYYQLFISSYDNIPPDDNNFIYRTDINKLKYNTYYYLSDFTLQDDTTYFWRIKIFDEVYGEHTYSTTTYWFYTCALLRSASLKSPQDKHTTSYFYPRFEWESNLSGYKINFTSQTLIYWTGSNTTTISGLSSQTTFYIPTQKLKNNTTYFWQIITHSNSFDIPLISSASIIFSFYIFNSSPIAFELKSPSATMITTNSTILKWEASSDPDNDSLSYDVFYSTNNFLTQSSFSGLNTTYYNLINLQDNTTYYWYVLAVDTWGFSRASNSTFYFVVNHTPENPTVFSLLFPYNNQLLVKTYTTFYWEASYDPDPFENIIYELKISTDINFSYIVFSTKTTQTQIFLPKGYLKTNTTYYWVVVSSSVGSGFTICNSTFSFKIINTAPQGLNLISPQNYAILKSSPINIIWSAAYDPQGDEFWYELYYTTSVGINNMWLSTTTITIPSTEYVYTIPFPIDDTTYYWYIVAVDTYNNTNSLGPFVFRTSFYNQPPSIPTILSPQQNEEVFLPYTIKWTTSNDLDLFDKVKYTLQISTEPNFSFYSTIVSSVEKTEYEISNFSMEPTIYYLRVISFDENNEVAISTISFIINRYYLTIISPLFGSIIQSLPVDFSFSKINPKNVNDIVKYKIIYSSSSIFDFKKEHILDNNFYQISTPPLYPSTYYWYVEVYYNNSYAGGSSTFSFVVPNIFPPSPQNVYISTVNYTVKVTWDSVNINNLWGYKIYSGYDLNNLSQVGFTTSTYYIDYNGFDKNLFYMIVSLNQFGTESINNVCVKLCFGEQASCYISQDKFLIFSIASKENLSNVVITRLTDEENENCIYVYDITADKTKLNSFSEISILKPQGLENYVVQYYDGHNWINFHSKEVDGRIVIKTQYLGKYRLVLLREQLEDKVSIIGCSPKKRIITPNNDGVNDYIEFHYKIGGFIEGNVYDLYGKK
ncbi:MAG: fibronectin type III domain-containing protein, partial [Endomicrobia bacterium]|nr:fibronectin type III domain-containing protein [Endomicrobiia bacterium]